MQCYTHYFSFVPYISYASLVMAFLVSFRKFS
jgi:hypothetical protein